VRLAFAVAAHLNPEILLIDEVLAVGDVAFQKKCLGKMRDVSQSGRTILFVSHDMGAIQSLCSRCIVLSEGQVIFDGATQTAVAKYLSVFQQPTENLVARSDRVGTQEIVFSSIEVKDAEGNSVDVVCSGQEMYFSLKYHEKENTGIARNLVLNIYLTSDSGVRLLQLSSRYSSSVPDNIPSTGSIDCRIKHLPLLPGSYWISIACKDNTTMLDYVENAFQLTIVSGHFPTYLRLPNNNAGPFLVPHQWTNESPSEQTAEAHLQNSI
jgi:lipopolysaccharide transport system ATP-binding protein